MIGTKPKAGIARWSAFVLAAAFTVAAIVGCGGGGSNVTSSGGGGGNGAGQTGTLAVQMADQPVSSATAVDVTITKVEANVNGSWTTVANPQKTFNLFDLTTQDTLLGSANLPAGHYTQLRMFVSAATITDATGTHDVTIPSGSQTGIKINVDYTISANVITTVLLDFNANQSIVSTGSGKFMLKPVIPAVVVVLSGTITGTVSDGVNLLAGASVRAKYTAGSNYTIGTVVNTSATMADGSFKIWALLPGTYELDVTYTNPVTKTTFTATLGSVNVSANENTNVAAIVVH